MERRGWGMSGEGDLDLFYLAEMKINKIMAERNMATSEPGRTAGCSAGYKQLNFGGSLT